MSQLERLISLAEDELAVYSTDVLLAQSYQLLAFSYQLRCAIYIRSKKKVLPSLKQMQLGKARDISRCEKYLGKMVVVVNAHHLILFS